MLILYQQFSFHVCCVFHLEIPIQMLRYYLNQQRTCSSYASPFLLLRLLFIVSANTHPNILVSSYMTHHRMSAARARSVCISRTRVRPKQALDSGPDAAWQAGWSGLTYVKPPNLLFPGPSCTTPPHSTPFLSS